MTDLTEDLVRDWLEAQKKILDRAKEKLGRRVDAFLSDWAVTWEFSHEGVEKTRVKDAPRVHRKAQRRGLSSCDQLLERCYEKDGRRRFPVQDLLGVRVLVRSLNDVAGVRLAIEELHASGDKMYPFGNHEDFDLEDVNEDPRKSGYRALHVDGSVTVRELETDFTIPFEVQIKTLAQHVYGQHTHDEAYVADDVNADVRYETVRGLQHALAEQLNGVDLLLAQIEDAANAIRDDIERREVGEDITPASVSNSVQARLGYKLRQSAAAEVSERALRSGIGTTASFLEVIDPAGDAAAAFGARFQAHHGRIASPRELLFGLLGDSDLPEEESAEIAPTAELEEALSQQPPPNALDELDPDEDLVPATEALAKEDPPAEEGPPEPSPKP
jgi:ppGpp synthetase/RelA/SpoT-type nucleotidyltranferase